MTHPTTLAMRAARDALADALEGYAFNEHDTSVYGAALSLLSAAIDAAPAGDPVAWLFVYANPAMNWASTKPPPAPETGQPWTSAPLYLHPVPTVDADAVRRAALEEAAQVADDKAQLIEDGLDDVQLGDEPMAYASAFTCRAVRDAIRALATPAPVTPGSISAPALNQTAGSVEGAQP